MRRARELRVRDPVDALAAHLDQAARVAVHPHRHRVAADARLRTRALGHAGRRVVRAARAEVRHAAHVVGRIGRQRRADELDHAIAPVERRPVAREPFGEDRQHPRRAKLADVGQQRLAVRIGLADDRGPTAGRRVVEQLAHLLLYNGALLLHHQNLVEAARELAHPRRLDRVGQAHLVEADAGALQIGQADVDAAQALQQVEVRLAAGDDAQVRIARRADRPVDRLQARELAHCVEPLRHPRLDRGARHVVGPIVQATGTPGLPRCAVRLQRRGETGRARCFGRARPVEARLQGIEVDGRRALDDLRDRLDAHPGAGVARQRPAVQPELDQLGDARGAQHRHAPRHHREVALVGHRRGHAAVIVAGHHQHAAVGRGAARVAVLERIGRAIDTGPLAVPEPEHRAHGALRVALDLLRAEHRGGGQLLVDRRQEADVGRVEPRPRTPQLLVVGAERRAAIAADEAGGVEPARSVERALHQRQPHQRLRAGEEDRPRSCGEAVLEPVVDAQRGGRNEQAIGRVHGRCATASRDGVRSVQC